MDEEKNSRLSGELEAEEENEGGVQIETEQVKPKKPRRPLQVLKLQDFTDRTKGLKLLYDAISDKTQKLESRAHLQPDKALKDYISLIKEWAFNLAPKYEFSYMMERTQALGRKKEIHDELESLRLYHQGRLVYNSELQLFENPSSANLGSSAIQSAKPRVAEATRQPSKTVRLTAEQGPVSLESKKRVARVEDEREAQIPYTFGATAPEEEIFDNYADEEGLAYPIKKKVKENGESGATGSPDKKPTPGKMRMENFQTFGE